MKILRSVSDFKNFRSEIASDKKIGFVPTMGALHAGHVSLIKKCREQNDVAIVSTFVNPAQFLPGEDLQSYPKNESGDIKICESCGVDGIFIPNAEEIYGSYEPAVIAPKPLSEILEGKSRPGHFDGVLTVLNKFFNLARPHNVYMGKKDAQQLFIVQNMVRSFFMNINIVPCEIVRESDGLALSSRNAYLDEEEKLLALKLSRSLQNASALVKKGEISLNIIREKMLAALEPLKVDYIAFVDHKFNEISQIKPADSIILLAAKVGKTRLIDNIWL